MVYINVHQVIGLNDPKSTLVTGINKEKVQRTKVTNFF